MRKKSKQKKANKAKQFVADDFLEYGESPYKEHLENCIRISKSRRKRQRSKVEVMVTLSLLQFQWKIKERTHAPLGAKARSGCREPILDQANKSTGWMPWHQEPKKDVASCEKPW